MKVQLRFSSLVISYSYHKTLLTQGKNCCTKYIQNTPILKQKNFLTQGIQKMLTLLKTFLIQGKK